MKSRIINGVRYYEIPKSVIAKKHKLNSLRGCKFCDLFDSGIGAGSIEKGCSPFKCYQNEQIYFKTKRSFIALIKGENPYGTQT